MYEFAHAFQGVLLGCGRDSAKRVVSDTYTQKSSSPFLFVSFVEEAQTFLKDWELVIADV